MSERSAELELTTWGVENTAGTAVAAALILASLTARAKPVEPSAMLGSPGFTSDVMQVLQGGAMTNIALSASGTVFDDLLYLYANCLKAPAFTTPEGATLARDATFLPAPFSPGDGTGVTMTAEGRGSDGSASRIAYCSTTGIDIDVSQTAVSMSGTMIGQRIAEQGVTSTATPAGVSFIPASPTGVDFYVASSLAGLADGQFLRFFKGKHSIGDRRSPVFPRQSALKSYAALVQGKAKCMLHVEIENNADSYTLMNQLRAAGLGFCKLIVRGPLIETVDAASFYHELEFIQPFMVANPDRGPSDKVYGGMYDLMAVPDLSEGGLGSFLQVRIRTTITALAAAADLGGGQQPEALIAAALAG